MSKYDIASFRKNVNEIKNNLKPDQCQKKCNLCNQSLSECKTCPLILELNKVTQSEKEKSYDKWQNNQKFDKTQNGKYGSKEAYNSSSQNQKLSQGYEEPYNVNKTQSGNWQRQNYQHNKGYQKGNQQSYQHGNQKYYQKGSKQGYEQTSQKGYQQGSKQGSEQGSEQTSQKGYQKGYEQVPQKGYQQESDKVSQKGYQQGYKQGSEQTSQKGYQKGSEQVPQKGYQQGFEKISQQGSKQESEQGSKQEHEQVSQQRYQPGSGQGYNQGYQQGSGQGYNQQVYTQPYKQYNSFQDQDWKTNSSMTQTNYKPTKDWKSQPTTYPTKILETAKEEYKPSTDQVSNVKNINEWPITSAILEFENRYRINTSQKAIKEEIIKEPKNFYLSETYPLKLPTTIPTPIPIRFRKRKRTSSGLESATSGVKRRKKTEEIVISFSKIIEELYSSMTNDQEMDKSITSAMESINNNMEDYSDLLNRLRSNITFSLDDTEDIKSTVYKNLIEELQSLYELSNTLHGKWRKKVIEIGAENISIMFEEKRNKFPDDFLTSIDDEIVDGLLNLKTSEGKPNNVSRILNIVNDAEYYMQFMSFVKKIKGQGSLSLKPEIIEDVIKEYIIEDLDERTKKETRKLLLLSGIMSKIDTKNQIETINLSIKISVSELSKMADRAKKYFSEIPEIIQILPLNVEGAALSPGNLKTKLFTDESPEAAWKRAFIKYSPTEDTTVSPIKQIQANLTPNIKDDSAFLGITWILEMSEQFYYDNTLMLTSHKKEDPKAMCQILKVNFQLFDINKIMEEFIDVVVLGSGSFGDVYRVTKKGTDSFFSIKYMKKFQPGLLHTHFERIVSFLQERNYLIAAKNSPYVVKFLQSFKITNLNGFFLLFEWCLSDLRRFVELLNFENQTGVSILLWEAEKNGIAKVFEKAKTKYDIDFYPIVVIYIFEIFCGLDFLAKSNIIHQDLKPENILISHSLHLKIGDFGLVFNTKFITKPHQHYLIDVSDLDSFVNEPIQEVFGGTELYSDMELSYKILKHYYPEDAKELIYHPNSMDFDISSVSSDPTFMSDLWAGGVIVSELLLGGTFFLYDRFIDENVKKGMELTGNHINTMLKITYFKENYKKYVVDGLYAYGGEEYHQLMTFLASIFTPRELRCVDFVKEKEIYFYQKKVLLKYIDISKIEKIDIFIKMQLNSNNAFLYEIEKKLESLLGKRLKIQYKTFGELLNSSLGEDMKDLKIIDLKPGTDLNID